MCISNAPLNGLPREGVLDKPTRFDSYIREIYKNFQILWVYPIPLPGSNHWLVHNSHFDKDYLHMFKSLQQWYLKGKAYYTCKSFVLIEFWLLADNSSILSTIHQLCFVYFCTLILARVWGMIILKQLNRKAIWLLDTLEAYINQDSIEKWLARMYSAYVNFVLCRLVYWINVYMRMEY